MPVIEREPCYIYNMREYQEHSLILEAISLNLGAIAILARGAKRPDSPLKGLFQPFTPLLLSLQLGQKGDLYYLKDYEYCPGGYHFVIPESFCAFYLNELLHLLYHGKESDKLLFGHYIATLEAIEHKDKIEYHLRSFELHLLKSLGYGISPLDEFGAPVQADKRYRFCFGVGFVEVNPDLMGQVMRAQTAPRSKSTSAERPAERSSESADDGLLFAKSKIRGPKLADTRTSARSSPVWVQRALSQGVSSSDLKRYYEYNGEFLGPILTGAEIQDIVSLQFTDPNSLHIAKTLTSSVIDRLTGGVELNSRKLYREYLHLCKQKAQAAATAAPSAQTAQQTLAPAQPVASAAAAQAANSVPEVSAEHEVVPEPAPVSNAKIEADDAEPEAAPAPTPPVTNAADAQGANSEPEVVTEPEVEAATAHSLETNTVPKEQSAPVFKTKRDAKASTKSVEPEVAPATASSLETNAAPEEQSAPVFKTKRDAKASNKSTKSEVTPAAASYLETNTAPEEQSEPVSKAKRATKDKPSSKSVAPEVAPAALAPLETTAAFEDQPVPVSKTKRASKAKTSAKSTVPVFEAVTASSLETSTAPEEMPAPVSKAKGAPKAKSGPVSKAKRASKASTESTASEVEAVTASPVATNVAPEDKPTPVFKAKRPPKIKPTSQSTAPKVALASVLSLKPNASLLAKPVTAELEGAGAELVLTPQVVAPEAMALKPAAAPAKAAKIKAAKAGKKLTRTQLRAREKAAAAARAQAEQERLAASPYDESMLMMLDASLHRRVRRKKG